MLIVDLTNYGITFPRDLHLYEPIVLTQTELGSVQKWPGWFPWCPIWSHSLWSINQNEKKMKCLMAKIVYAQNLRNNDTESIFHWMNVDFFKRYTYI